jgi:hypothetical protein
MDLMDPVALSPAFKRSRRGGWEWLLTYYDEVVASGKARTKALAREAEIARKKELTEEFRAAVLGTCKMKP